MAPLLNNYLINPLKTLNQSERQYSIPLTCLILIQIHTFKFSRRWLLQMVNEKMQTSSICFVLHFVTTFLNGNFFSNFMQSPPNCVFNELETTFCKHYQKVQINEQVYMWHFESSNKKQTRKSKFITNAFWR